MYKQNFDFIVDKAKTIDKPIRVVIAGADCENILRGAFEAEAAGFAELILAGNEKRITEMLKNLGLITRKYTLEPVTDEDHVVQHCIDLIHDGKADVLMRGNTQTRDFLLPIMDHNNHLLTEGRLLTQVTMVKFAEYSRVLAVSDVTVLVRPDQNQRKKIVENMVGLLKVLGYEKPNIALLALTEQPAFHMPDTIEAQNIVHDHNERPIADCNLVGPISYDLIVSKEAARLKGYDCPLCGEFDGIVVPDLLTVNLLIKALQMNGHASSCGVVVGARVPIALTSRSDTKEQSFLSLAACAAMHMS
jgi:phosphotransacetylase